MKTALLAFALLLTASGCPAETPQKPATCHEGDSCWNCKTDGNKRCGSSDRKRLSPEVGNRGTKPNGVVAKGAEPGIAGEAQQSANRTRLVVMVNVQNPVTTARPIAPADRAASALAINQRLVALDRESVFTGQLPRPVPSHRTWPTPSHPHLAPPGTKPELVDWFDGVASFAQLVRLPSIPGAWIAALGPRVAFTAACRANTLGSVSGPRSGLTHGGTLSASSSTMGNHRCGPTDRKSIPPKPRRTAVQA